MPERSSKDEKDGNVVMQEKVILDPCPFCGSASVALVGVVVRCGNCCASGPYGITREAAIQRWNERASAGF